MKTSWILLLGAVAGLTACHRNAEAPAPPIRPVLSIVAAPEAAGGAAFAGTVEARYESILGFQVLGRMIARDVNVGDQVKQSIKIFYKCIPSVQYHFDHYFVCVYFFAVSCYHVFRFNKFYKIY